MHLLLRPHRSMLCLHRSLVHRSLTPANFSVESLTVELLGASQTTDNAFYSARQEGIRTMRANNLWLFWLIRPKQTTSRDGCCYGKENNSHRNYFCIARCMVARIVPSVDDENDEGPCQKVIHPPTVLSRHSSCFGKCFTSTESENYFNQPTNHPPPAICHFGKNAKHAAIAAIL